MTDAQFAKGRTKTLDVTPLGDERFQFVGRLTDRAVNGNFPGESVTIHDFGVEGVVEGPNLTLVELDVAAYAHPYPDCPFAIPPVANLIGLDVARGWRRAVLEVFAGARGCTHVTTLLLGLSELSTIAIFLQINPAVPYTPETRRNGQWIKAAHAFAPKLADACYGLRADGPVIREQLGIINDSVD
jgi:hypothetical protein